MPKITVNERDLSWYSRQRETGEMTILMPGIANWGPYEPTFVNDTNFVQTFGSSPMCSGDISYIQAASFIKSGFNVLFWRINLDGQAAQLALDDLGLTIKAKYAGTYGNNIHITIRGGGDTRTITAYINNMAVEQLICNFSDYNSIYYYGEVNRLSKFIEIEVGDEGFNKDAANPTEDLKLAGGTNGFDDDADFEEDIKAKVLELFGASSSEEPTPEPEPEPTPDPGDNSGDTTNNSVNPNTRNLRNRAAAVSTDVLADVDDTIKAILMELVDPLIYDFDLIVDGGFNDVTEDAETISKIDQIFTSLARTKGMAVYLVDGHKNMDAETFYSYCGLPDLADSTTVGFNTSYAAAFGPWSSSLVVSNGATRILPGSYPLLVAWGRSMSKGNPAWMAPAGVKRASVGQIVQDTVYPVGSAVIELWQNQDFVSVSTPHKVNPITRLKQYGFVVYGNSTLLKSHYDGATSMLQSFSTRILANLIKRRAFEISLRLQFDQIDDDLFVQFKALMATYMDQLKYGGALYDYRILADRSLMSLDDLNQKTVPVRIQISPNPAVENFVINLEISQAGVTFGDDSDNIDFATESV